jgi:molecular chaperone HscB
MASAPSAPAERETAERACCWSCGAVHALSLFCPACEAIQPLPVNADYFRILGVERRLVLDGASLERRYFDLSRRLHPDRYQTGPSQARIASLGNTAALNRAYRALRDPIERGVYWLGLQGESLGGDNNRVPRALAERVFEVQDKLAQLRASGERGGPLAQEVRDIHAALKRQDDLLAARLDENFARWDSGAADPETLTAQLKDLLSEVAYLRKLISDVDKELSR